MRFTQMDAGVIIKGIENCDTHKLSEILFNFNMQQLLKQLLKVFSSEYMQNQYLWVRPPPSDWF